MNKQELHAFVAKQQPNICQIVAYRSGKKVYSDCWNDYKEDDCVHIMSATKSIIALLIGIALDKGQIGTIDIEPIKKGERCKPLPLTHHRIKSSIRIKQKSLD